MYLGTLLRVMLSSVCCVVLFLYTVWLSGACDAIHDRHIQGRGNRPPHPPAGGAPAMSRSPASVAILLLFYFFNFENYNLYFHDQMPRAAGWNRGGSAQPSSPLCVVPRPSLAYRPGSENKMAEQTGRHCRSGDEVKYDFCYEFLRCS